ncbi:nischarin-like [Macrobrachium nipponense]|uniref:nischarin-like n=1 Tax=Macrobrachium nipponense TaxID=159736 RepID=UPI0030C7C3C0
MALVGALIDLMFLELTEVQLQIKVARNLGNPALLFLEGDCLPPSASFLFGTGIATSIQEAISGSWLAASVAGVPGSQEAIASAKEGDPPKEACTSARTDVYSKLFTPVKTDAASKETDASAKADAASEEVDASAKADAPSKEASAPDKADAVSKGAGAPAKADAASEETSAPAKADAASEEASATAKADAASLEAGAPAKADAISKGFLHINQG